MAVSRSRVMTVCTDLMTRRGSLRSLAALLVSAGAVAETAAAEHPVRGVQHRADKRRDRKHHRLKQKRRQQRRNQNQNQGNEPGDIFQKGISILLRNPATAVSTPHIEVTRYDCSPPFACPVCTAKAVFDIAPGGPDRVFDTDSSQFTIVQVKRRYLIGFTNPLFARPYIKAWLANDDNLCHTNVTQVLDDYPLDLYESYSFAIDGHTFTVTRNGDKSDFKYFTLELATNL